jgi:integrase/recombinase XerD
MKKDKNTTIVNNITLDDAFSEFLAQKTIAGLSLRTINDHKTHYRYFQHFLSVKKKKVTFLHQVTKKLCQDYVLYMKTEKVKYDDHQTINTDQQGLSISTMNIRIRSLRAQFNFYVKEGFIKVSPFQDITPLKVDESEIKFLETQEYCALLRIPDRKTFSGFRDYVLLTLLIVFGGRIGETLRLNIDNINFDNRYITLPGTITKNDHSRILPISDRMVFLLKRLIEWNTKINDESIALFLSSNGNRLKDSSFRYNLNTYKEKAGLQKRVTPHVFRHTFCVSYLRNGGDLDTMMEIAGHISYESAKKYLIFVPEILREKMVKHSPLSE